MEQYVLSEDRIMLVNKVDGDYIITLKQKDSDEKCVVFTANRYLFIIIHDIIIMLSFLSSSITQYRCHSVTKPIYNLFM